MIRNRIDTGNTITPAVVIDSAKIRDKLLDFWVELLSALSVS